MNRRALAGVVAPLGSALLTTFALIILVPRLPDPLAVHWGAGGEPDGFVSPASYPWLALALHAGITGFLALLATIPSRSVVGERVLPGVPLAMSWFMGVLLVGSAASQVGADGSAPFPGWALAGALAAGVLGWLVGRMVAGPVPEAAITSEPAPVGMPRLALAPGTTAVWSGATPTSPVLRALAILVAISGIAIGWAVHWVVALLLLPVALLMLASSTFTVTVGPAGIRVRGLMGVPRLRVPLEQIASVSPGTVDAFSFGGWGMRAALSGESAVITRSGPALVVERTDGAVLRVSLDHPETAASLAATLLDRRS